MLKLRATDQVELKSVEQTDANLLFALADKNRKYLRPWLPWLDATRSVEDTARFIEMSLRQHADGKGFQAGIWFKSELCGMIGHHEVDRLNRSTSLGYWLDADHQGRGIMTASCRAVIHYAFNDMGLNRLVIRCATGNQRSRAIPERLGFTLEGVARQSEWLYDHFVDLAIYSLLHSDPPAREIQSGRGRPHSRT